MNFAFFVLFHSENDIKKSHLQIHSHLDGVLGILLVQKYDSSENKWSPWIPDEKWREILSNIYKVSIFIRAIIFSQVRKTQNYSI